MSVNKYLPHVLVLPEDDANRQMANGFFLDQSFGDRGTSFQILPVAGGWSHVRDLFRSDHIRGMETYPKRFMILLIDFDDDLDRIKEMKAAIPEHLTERVFILGALKEPEALRSAGLGSLEKIGLSLAKDCREGTETTWRHDLLRHNADELVRLHQHVRPILFGSV